uniref:Uncharacterized protein n=1 Tax=Tetraselmis sp. GSL018 TaxID=582737 RepID=A0A061QZY7_9CHLO
MFLSKHKAYSYRCRGLVGYFEP